MQITSSNDGHLWKDYSNKNIKVIHLSYEGLYYNKLAFDSPVVRETLAPFLGVRVLALWWDVLPSVEFLQLEKAKSG